MNKQIQTNKFFFLTAVLTVLVVFIFFTKSNMYIDPDFGYRYKTGQIIISEGFPYTDPYSYTMPSFPYVEHAWIIAVFWALVFPYIGHIGLAVISALLAFFALVISYNRRSSYKVIFPFQNVLGYFSQIENILAVIILLAFIGVRAQVYSWIIISIYFHLILRDKLWEKYRFLTPLFFLAWANTHGSWSAGIAILFATILLRSVERKKLLISDGIIAVISFAITLINPYGTGLWNEVRLSITDPEIRNRISEWMPALLNGDYIFALYLTYACMFITISRKKFSLTQQGLFVIILIQALMSRRHIPLWIFYSLPLVTSAQNYFYEKIKKITFAPQRYYVFYKYLLGGIIVLSAIRILFIYKSTLNLRASVFYPSQALEYLNNNDSSGNLFSYYGWGGYIIQQEPHIKVYVYGAMPSWRRNVSPSNEIDDAFTNYLDIVEGKTDYKKDFTKFNIDTVLFPTQNSNNETQLEKTISTYLKSILKNDIEDKNNFFETLEANNWMKVYSDSVSTIYRRPHSEN